MVLFNYVCFSLSIFRWVTISTKLVIIRCPICDVCNFQWWLYFLQRPLLYYTGQHWFVKLYTSITWMPAHDNKIDNELVLTVLPIFSVTYFYCVLSHKTCLHVYLEHQKCSGNNGNVSPKKVPQRPRLKIYGQRSSPSTPFLSGQQRALSFRCCGTYPTRKEEKLLQKARIYGGVQW